MSRDHPYLLRTGLTIAMGDTAMTTAASAKHRRSMIDRATFYISSGAMTVWLGAVVVIVVL